MKLFKKQIFKDIGEMFFPADIKCIICDCELSEKNELCICDKCVLPYVDKHCDKCGRQIASVAKLCDSCINYPPAFFVARSALNFDSEVKNLIYRFKYGNEQYLKTYLAKLLYNEFITQELNADIITSVPIHPKRKRQRGYNQSTLLARELAALCNIPFCELLVKNKHTKNMAKLSANERKELIKDSFSLIEGDVSYAIKGATVLVVDDVFTTGATLSECAKMLLKAKAGKVVGLTVASLPVKVGKEKERTLQDMPTLAE